MTTKPDGHQPTPPWGISDRLSLLNERDGTRSSELTSSALVTVVV
jgi:hypothetical protein